MRGPVIVVCVLFLMIQALAVGFGFTVAPRLLFPLYRPYQPDMLWDPDQGVMWGFGFSFDLWLFPGFTAGPYFGGLFNTDTFRLDDYTLEGAYRWTDLVIGARFKYAIPTGSPWRPWLFVAPGYGSLSATLEVDNPWVNYEIDYKNTGGFGLDAGIGVDYRISETFFVGFGLDLHLNTADKVERKVDGQTWEFELEESPVGLGFGIEVGVCF
ncbi:hypothetical protein KAU45_07570 [bacterium]|nr:hypothetical protein [bacterium]